VIYIKKSQIQGEILIYILAVIIFSLTLLYGYKAIKSFNDQGAQISQIELKNQITSEVEKVRSDTYGTIKKLPLNVPGNFRKICFVQSYPDYPAGGIIVSPYQLINNEIAAETKNKNMFLAPDGSTSFDIGEIAVTNGTAGFDCIDLLGTTVTLKLESMGDHVKISKWQ